MTKPSQLYGRPWGEAEYIVVLDSYFATKGQPRHENSPFVKELASLLGRTPSSIYMRMENFASIDPAEANHRRGLTKISPECRKVFQQWANNLESLRQCAQVLRRADDARRSLEMSLFEPDPVAIPKAFGKYELLDPIGRGGFGIVFSCLNTEDGHQGAIKIIQADKINDRESFHRFLREIRALRLVRHPNVIRLHADNLDTEKDFPAFVMDLAETSLTNYVNDRWPLTKERPVLSEAEALGIVRAMVDAVKALHSLSPQIIHRDVNPNNILRLLDGTWVLADFGLAKFIGNGGATTTFATRTQAGVGTGYYAAPEQYQDFKRTNERTDVYALGILLWELMTKSGPPPDRQVSGLTVRWHNVFVQATDRDPRRRFASVAEFGAAVERAAALGSGERTER